MINLLNISRAVVAQTENERFLTEEVGNGAAGSMEKLGISNRAYLLAQKRVRALTQDLHIPPEDFLNDEDDTESPIKL